MADRSDIYEQLCHKFRHSASVEEIIPSLEQLDNFIQSGELSTSDTYDLRLDAFLTLQKLTVDDPTKGEQLIFNLLLPSCLEQPEQALERVTYTVSRYRKCLADWLDSYPEAIRMPLREKILDKLLQDLESENPTGSCWTIGWIGFRRGDILEALWKIVNKWANEVGDVALHVLTGLGVAPEERTQLLSTLHHRVALRCNPRLIGALRRLADPESINIVTRFWLEPNSKIEVDNWNKSSALRVLVAVADTHNIELDLQDRVWDLLSNLFHKYSDVFSSDLYLGGDIAPRCDSENVVPSLLQWLSKRPTEEETKADYERYLLSLRLEQCVRPRQLKGWAKADEPSALSILRQDANRNTGYKGRSTSEEMIQKEMAWKILLCLGQGDVLAWFEQSVATETNPFLRRKISDLLACFRLDPLPPAVLRWVIELYDGGRSDDSGEWSSRMGSIRIAQSAASWQAFEALSQFGFTMGGDPLQQSVDALAEVAITLARAGEVTTVEKLVEIAVNGSEWKHRTAAAGALERIVSEDLLPLKYIPQLVTPLFDEKRTPFERSLFITILGYLSPDEIPPDLTSRLETWANERTDWLGGRSLETLARQGYLLTRPHLLSERLSLRQEENKWNLLPGAKPIEWAAFIIGLLYSQNLLLLAPAVASILKTQNWPSAVQIINWLNRIHGKPNQPPLAVEIREALIERTHRQQTHTSAEAELFRVLTYLIPDALAEEPWEKEWKEWLPQARTALADALGEAKFTDLKFNTRTITLLQVLTKDSRYDVRRAAYRALVRRSSQGLETLCITWSSEESPVELRQRAAEACAWLASDNDQSKVFDDLYQQLSIDSEVIVRDTVERARVERRERLWAESYLLLVLNVKGINNEEILLAWPYGQALMQIGDDACSRTLRDHLRHYSLPPNVRFWLQQIVKGIDEHWRKVTKKWPDPWLSWEGAVEEIQGTIMMSNGRTVLVNCSLWQQPAPTPTQLHSWGGTVQRADGDQIFPFDPGEFILQLEDGRQGKGLTTRVFGSVASFVGLGPYLSLIDSEAEGES